MPIDGCHHDFKTLASEVLPARMQELRDHMRETVQMAEFAVWGDGPKTIARRHGFPDDISGCYVFMEGDEPIYVGISRRVFARLAEHVGRGGHLSATLAYRMAAHDVMAHGTSATSVSYHPTLCAPFVTVPTLLMVAPEDEMVHANYSVSRQAYELLSGPKRWYDIAGGHFGLLYYPSELFEETSQIQAQFLRKWL